MQTPKNLQDAKSTQPYSLLKQGIIVLSGLSILGSGLCLTQTVAATDSLVIPDGAAPSAPSAQTEPASVAPVIVPKAAPEPVFQPRLKPPIPKRASHSSVSRESALTTPRVRLAAPRVSLPSSNNSASNDASSITPLATQGKNSYIDMTRYSPVESQPYAPPSAVVLSERSTGCQTVSQNAQMMRGSCGNIAKQQRILTTARTSSSSRWRASSPSMAIASLQPVGMKNHSFGPNSFRSRQFSRLNPPQNRGVSLAVAPISEASPVRLGNIAIEPMPEYNRATSMYQQPNPQAIPNYGRTDLMFPVPIVARITSAFGYRLHPISGTYKMHEGTDIAAPQGTPVLAAYAGQVASADWMGGYGLMVVLRHLEGTQESRYGHLSEVFVQPGELVEKGTVIGRVGSTGYSTGPHLHFEWRHLTPDGWVAVDAGVHLEYALDNLMRSLQLADTQAKPQG